MDTKEFDEIRPFHDEELPCVFDEMLADPAFKQMATAVFPEFTYEELSDIIRSCKTKDDFQRAICYVVINKIIKNFTSGVTLDYTELSHSDKAHTYISNHRDITLDSSFLSVKLIDAGLGTVEIAIGDNLLMYPWIKNFVRVNKSFIVQRGLNMRQILESSARMSRYMHYAIKHKNESIWIAQREGRAKNSDDRTQESVLKMMAMGGDGDVIDRLMQMNIAPLTLSYEYDPCDYLKAKEFQEKRDNPEYKKTAADDMANMRTGITGQKGRIHMYIADCINDELNKIDRSLPKTDIFTDVAGLIDKTIHRNYRFYPCNYVAYDLLTGTEEFASHYSDEEKAAFEAYLAGQIEKIDLENKDIPFLYESILGMYANPVKNYLIAIQ